MDVLAVEGLVKDFRGFRAVDGINLRVEVETVHALVGPNGAGKTTLFNLLSGFLPPTAGRISFRGEDVTRLPPEARARRGMARSFQITSLFEQLGVREHVMLAMQAATPLGYRFWQSDRVLDRFHEPALAVLDRVGLRDVAASPVATLP